MNLDELLRILTPTLLGLLVAGLIQLGRWVLQVRDHLIRLNGTVESQAKAMAEHFANDETQFSEMNKLLYTQQGQLNEKMRENP